MAGSNRRFALAAVALPFLFLVMSGLARANVDLRQYSRRRGAILHYVRCPMRSLQRTSITRLAGVSLSREPAPTR